MSLGCACRSPHQRATLRLPARGSVSTASDSREQSTRPPGPLSCGRTGRCPQRYESDRERPGRSRPAPALCPWCGMQSRCKEAGGWGAPHHPRCGNDARWYERGVAELVGADDDVAQLVDHHLIPLGIAPDGPQRRGSSSVAGIVGMANRCTFMTLLRMLTVARVELGRRLGSSP